MLFDEKYFKFDYQPFRDFHILEKASKFEL